jgi:hypothetical protein
VTEDIAAANSSFIRNWSTDSPTSSLIQSWISPCAVTVSPLPSAQSDSQSSWSNPCHLKPVFKNEQNYYSTYFESGLFNIRINCNRNIEWLPAITAWVAVILGLDEVQEVLRAVNWLATVSVTVPGPYRRNGPCSGPQFQKCRSGSAILQLSVSVISWVIRLKVAYSTLLWGTNWTYICYVEDSRPPLFSSGQSSWLHNGDVLCSCEVRTELIYVI